MALHIKRQENRSRDGGRLRYYSSTVVQKWLIKKYKINWTKISALWQNAITIQKKHCQLSQFQTIRIPMRVKSRMCYQLLTAVNKDLVRKNPTGRFLELIFEYNMDCSFRQVLPEWFPMPEIAVKKQCSVTFTNWQLSGDNCWWTKAIRLFWRKMLFNIKKKSKSMYHFCSKLFRCKERKPSYF